MKKEITILLMLLMSGLANAQEFYTEVGQHFPEFEVLDLNSNIVSNGSLKGKPSLLIFFGTRCPPCLKELDKLNSSIPSTWYSKFNIYAIGSTDDASRLLRFNKKKNYKFNYIPDENQLIFNKIGDHTIPRTFLLDEYGNILSQTVGFYKTPFENLFKKMKRLAI